MDGAVPFAWRSQTKLPGGSQQKPVLLLRLWPRRRCDSLCRALSPGAVPASPGTAAPLAWRGAFTAGSCEVLWHAVTPSWRGGCLSAAPRTPLAGTDRAHAHRLRAGRLPARLVDAVGLPAPGSASSRFGFRRGIRHLHASRRFSAGRQSLWPQSFDGGAAASVFAGDQGRPVFMGASPAMPGSDSRRGSVRLCRVGAGRFSQRHLRAGKPSQCTPCSATVRRPRANRLCHRGCREQRQRPAGGALAGRPAPGRRIKRLPGLLTRWTRPEQLLRRWRQCPRVSTPVGRCLPVRFRVAQPYGLSNAQSPFRVTDDTGREVPWVNRFLDQQRVRSVADSTLRSYAHDLLHFLRWWVGVNQTEAITEKTLTASTLLDYIRFQTNQQPRPAAASINRRVGTAECALRREFPQAQLPFVPGFQYAYWRPALLGAGRPLPALSRLRVRTPRRVVVPLSVDEVAGFWASFRTSRDLAIVGLMLFAGLRSCEVLTLNCDDLLLPESQIRVRGKGNKVRWLPLAPEP